MLCPRSPRGHKHYLLMKHLNTYQLPLAKASLVIKPLPLSPEMLCSCCIPPGIHQMVVVYIPPNIKTIHPCLCFIRPINSEVSG